MSVKEDDVLRFVAGLAVFAVLPVNPPNDDNMLGVVGSICILQAAERLFSVPFSDSNMEKIRTGLYEKLKALLPGMRLSAAQYEKGGAVMAIQAGAWIAAYVNTIMNRAGDEPYEIALALSKAAAAKPASEEK